MQRAYELGTEGIYQEIEPIKKYRLFLMASMSDVTELVMDVQHREFEWCTEHSPQGQNEPPESRISYENGLIFESLYPPRLEGKLKNTESDWIYAGSTYESLDTSNNKSLEIASFHSTSSNQLFILLTGLIDKC